MSSPVTAQLFLIQGDSGFQQVIDLHNKTVTIGRAQNCDIIWGSLQISRQHATLEYLIPNKWYIRDTSTNGLSVNGNKLLKGELVPLKDADMISFIPTGSVRYRFKYAIGSSPTTRALAASRPQNQSISPQPSTSASIASSPSGLLPRSAPEPSNTPSEPEVLALISSGSDSDSNHSESLLSLDHDDYLNYSGDEPANSRSEDLPSDDGSSCPFTSKRKHIGGESSDSDSNIDKKKKRFNQFHLSSDDDDDSRSRSFTFRDTSDGSGSNAKKETGSKTKCKLMNDDQINNCEDLKTLKEQLRACMTKLGNTQCNLEALKFERDLEREELLKKENDVKSVTAAFQEETLKKFLDLMESELSCAVCNEIFIQATVIDCGHTFCSFCITEWARKKQECPICRKAFRNKSRHIEVENFIVRMFDTFTPETATRRKNSIKERDEQARKALEEAQAHNAANQRRGAEAHFPGFFQNNPRMIDFLAELNQINEILAAPNRNGRGNGTNSNAERRRSARIQDRGVDGVGGAAQGPLRGRHTRGRGRVAAANAAPANNNAQNPPLVPLPQPGGPTNRQNVMVNPAAPIPIVTLNDSANEDPPVPAGLRFPNQFINYVQGLNFAVPHVHVLNIGGRRTNNRHQAAPAPNQ